MPVREYPTLAQGTMLQKRACYYFKLQKEEKGCGGKQSVSLGLL